MAPMSMAPVSMSTVRAMPADLPTLQVQMVPPTVASPQNPRTGLLEYARMFSRSKWLILGMTLGFAACGYLLSKLQTPAYQARTALEIQGPNDNFLNLKDLDPSAYEGQSSLEPYVETQAKILRDEGLLDRTIAQLGLDKKPEAILAPGRFAWKKSKPTREALVRAAMGNLEVRASNQSRVIEVLFDAPDPDAASQVANTLADLFIEESLDNRWKARRRVSDWLSKELGSLKANLEQSAAELQTYAQNTGLVFEQQETTTIAQDRLRQVQEEYSRAQAERVAKQARYEAASKSAPESLPEVLDDGTLRDAQMKLTELQRQLAELNATFQPTYYKIQNVKAQIVELEAILRKHRINILDRIGNEYAAASRREKMIEANYRAQTGTVSGQAATAVHYQTLKRQMEANRALYESMSQKVRESEIASAIRASNIRVISPAKRPLQPYKPKPMVNAGMGLVAGLFLSTAFAFVRQQTDRRLRSPGDMAAWLNVPELGVIPRASPQSVAAPRRHKSDVLIDLGPCEPIALATFKSELSPLAESFRTALASVWFTGHNDHQQPRILVLTSPNPAEGKTTVVSNLGISIAHTRRRVLLIDGDIRKPRLNTIFGIDNGWGLGNLLEEDLDIEEYSFEELAAPTHVPGLFVLPSGSGEMNISSLRYHERLARLLSRFRLEYHAVLIDTPPVLEFADARLLGRLSDGVILVVRASETTRDDAGAALGRFHEDKTPVLGSILNDCHPQDSRYGYSYGSR